MRKAFLTFVAIWIIANVAVFLLPSIVNPFQVNINMEEVTHWTGVLNPFAAVIAGILGLITSMRKEK